MLARYVALSPSAYLSVRQKQGIVANFAGKDIAPFLR